MKWIYLSYFTDSRYTVEEIMGKLFQKENPVQELRQLDEKVRDAFYKRFTQEEQYKFAVLYKYAMLSEMIKIKENKEESLTREQLEEEVGWLQTFVSWIPKENEMLPKEKREAWDKNAFSLVVHNLKEITYKQNQDIKHITDFTTYTEYLQSKATFDAAKFLRLADALEAAKSEELAQANENFKKYLYDIYELETETKKSDDSLLMGVGADKSQLSVGPLALNGYSILKKDESGDQCWWIFVQVDKPTVTPTLAYRVTGSGNTKIAAMQSGRWIQDGKTYNYAYPMRVLEGNYGNYTYNVSIEGAYIGAKQFVFGNARIGNNYYWDLQQAVNAAGDYDSIYVFRDCTYSITISIRNKNISIYPESGDITLTGNAALSTGICVESSNVILGGNNGCTLTLNGSRDGITILSTESTVHLRLGVNICNFSRNGVICNTRNALSIASGVNVHDNGSTGVVSAGTLNIDGGNFSSNGQDGVTMLAANNTKLNVTGGSFDNNNRAGIAFGGINDEFSGITNYASLTGGDIHSNGIGMYLTYKYQNYWNVTASGIAIHNNNNKNTASVPQKGGGAFVNAKCTLTLSGSEIYNNTSVYGGGVYNAGTFNVLDGKIYSNSVTYGGAIFNQGAANIKGGVISGNKGTHGGTIEMIQGPQQISREFNFSK
ncbi:MAG: right-handed parallel beta-helix repeat-containing protein [Muricomes sp.]